MGQWIWSVFPLAATIEAEARRNLVAKVLLALHGCAMGRPHTVNQVWSMDFVFDRIAVGRVIKSLIVVDDTTHEAVAIVSEQVIGGQTFT